MEDYRHDIEKLARLADPECKIANDDVIKIVTTEALFALIAQSLGNQNRSPVFGQSETKMSDKYPAYFKDFSGNDEADVYLIHHKFGISDPAGCIHHASKKLLLSGVRTGGKSKYQDVKEARDTLNRWLQINQGAGYE